MSLAKEEIEAVVAYCKEKAYNTLKEAEDMIDTKHWNLAIQLLQNRITGDYNDFFDFTREDVAPLLEPTRNLLIKIEELIVF